MSLFSLVRLIAISLSLCSFIRSNSSCERVRLFTRSIKALKFAGAKNDKSVYMPTSCPIPKLLLETKYTPI